jgi:hypothetical protein
MIAKSLRLGAAALAVIVLITGLLLTAPRNVHNSESIAVTTPAAAALIGRSQTPTVPPAPIVPADVFEPGFDWVPQTGHGSN